VDVEEATRGVVAEAGAGDTTVVDVEGIVWGVVVEAGVVVGVGVEDTTGVSVGGDAHGFMSG